MDKSSLPAVEFVTIHPVTRSAKILYKDVNGVEVMEISEYTFKQLFKNWDTEKLGPMLDKQKRFKRIVEESIKDPISWFEQEANNCEKKRAQMTNARKAKETEI